METATLEKKIAKLPENLKLRVEGYVDALRNGDGNDKVIPDEINKNGQARRPIFGSGKGIFGKMADDFDAPLDDMKEYM